MQAAWQAAEHMEKQGSGGNNPGLKSMIVRLPTVRLLAIEFVLGLRNLLFGGVYEQFLEVRIRFEQFLERVDALAFLPRRGRDGLVLARGRYPPQGGIA